MKPMSAEAAERLANFNEEQADWYGFCPETGKKVVGSLKKLREWRCGAQGGDS